MAEAVPERQITVQSVASGYGDLELRFPHGRRVNVESLTWEQGEVLFDQLAKVLDGKERDE